MLSFLKNKYRKEQFKPSWFSIIFNAYYFNRKTIYSGLQKLIPQLSGDLLDFGCGVKPYKDLFHVNKYIGLDLDVNEGHNLPRTEIDVFYDGSKIPFKENTYDSIYTSEVFEHVFNLKEIISDINRVHKTGGKMLITMPFVWQEHEMPNDFGRYTSAGIKAILKECNYEIEEHIKGPSYFQSIMQLLACYIHHTILPKSNSLKFILAPLFIFPINLAGILLNFILPKNSSFYINHVILVRNVKS